MSKITKAVNIFFKFAIKEDIDKVENNIILSDRQWKIFRMFYLEKKDINFIADSLHVCSMVVNNELKTIRAKIIKLI